MNESYLVGKSYVDQTDSQLEGSGTFKHLVTDVMCFKGTIRIPKANINSA